MRDQFVDVCKTADKFDADCFLADLDRDEFEPKAKPDPKMSAEDREKVAKRDEECRKMRDQIYKAVFAGI
jgi:hypothetical protein